MPRKPRRELLEPAARIARSPLRRQRRTDDQVGDLQAEREMRRAKQ
jgi:hypothetical protein